MSILGEWGVWLAKSLCLISRFPLDWDCFYWTTCLLWGVCFSWWSIVDEGLRMLTQHEQLITMATWQHMETWQHVYWPTNNYGGQPGKTGLDETGNCRAPVMILQNRPVVVENWKSLFSFVLAQIDRRLIRQSVRRNFWWFEQALTWQTFTYLAHQSSRGHFRKFH